MLQMNRAFSDLGELQGHVLDTSDLRAEELLERVEASLAKGCYRLG